MSPQSRRYWARVYAAADRAEDLLEFGFSLVDVRDELRRLMPADELKATLRVVAGRQG